MVGYTGGQNEAPTYNSVCRGDGHTEALKVWFDPDKLSYEELLDAYFAMHSPYPGGKTQYKSAIWYHDLEQKKAVETAMKKHQVPSAALETKPAQQWHDAEEYHQKYQAKMGPSNGSWWFGD
eukprot:gnl/TRDRNA2_/TRDRNA2_200600_c0_seq1.p2 gnl/TRDRNA2_/TRDRNA2_200600_c0~~gnl/TRDRNA2_/TRDRNA2_200600_c0_seq1.p2  ORF type:complete len:122 (+),score=24.67 gnl/TRDRNA2_/TRDRNA2_200600_c0_seq1:467-832(+)